MADAFKKGMLESSAAAAGGWATQSLLELGACAGLATPASIVVGLLITAMFLTADGVNDKTPFEKLLQKFRGYVAGSATRFALSTPVVLLIGTQHELTSPAPDTVFYDVYPWDGTTVSAVGGQFYYGRYAYCYTCENDLATAYSVLYQAMTGEPEGN